MRRSLASNNVDNLLARWTFGLALAIAAVAAAGCSDEGSCAACGAGSGPDDAAVAQDTAPAQDGTPAGDAEPLQDAGLDAPGEAAVDASIGDSSSSDGATADAQPASLGTIGVQELYAALASKDFLLINVHIPYEGEIPGTDAKISYLEPQALAQYVGPDLDVKVVVYCMSNYMSVISGEDLVEMGYRNVRYLDGGMSAWTAAGYPLEDNP